MSENMRQATEVPPEELVSIELELDALSRMQKMALQMIMGEGGLRERDRIIAVIQTTELLTDEQKDGLLREIIPQKTETEGEEL